MEHKEINIQGNNNNIYIIAENDTVHKLPKCIEVEPEEEKLIREPKPDRFL